MKEVYSKIISTGAYLPEKCITNKDLEKTLQTSDEWIQKRVGIKQRFIADESQNLSDLAAFSVKNALEKTNLSANDLDAIIVATFTPDNPMPASAVMVQKKIGMSSGYAMDVNAACSGFIYALHVADGLIKSKKSKRIAVVGADIFSRAVDWNDRNTAVLFGDGAGCAIIESSDTPGILSTHVFSDGNFYNHLYAERETKDKNQYAKTIMMGSEVMKYATDKIGEAVINALSKNNLSEKDIDWFIPHQANKRIIESVSRRFKIPIEKFIITIDSHANTSAASIPLALNDAFFNKKIKSGHKVILESMGAGFTWGSALIQF